MAGSSDGLVDIAISLISLGVELSFSFDSGRFVVARF